MWVISDPPSVLSTAQLYGFTKLPCLERNTRVNFSFLIKGKSLSLYSFKANVLTD